MSLWQEEQRSKVDIDRYADPARVPTFMLVQERSHTAGVAATGVNEQLALAELTAGLHECKQRVRCGPRLFLPDCRAEAGPAST
jgi:hypothetical protein